MFDIGRDALAGFALEVCSYAGGIAGFVWAKAFTIGTPERAIQVTIAVVVHNLYYGATIESKFS